MIAGCFTYGFYVQRESITNLDQTVSELTSLPVADRLRVVESLWDSIGTDTPVPVSPEQRAEINRRIDAHERNPDELLTWNDVLDQLRDRKCMFVGTKYYGWI